MIKIKRGLDLPISGAPDQVIADTVAVRTVALIGADYLDLKPTMAVAVGDTVKKGQILFSDKRNPGVHITAPVAGTVAAINRGAKRVFQSLTIDIDKNGEAVEFAQHDASELGSMQAEQIKTTLLESGLWTALRPRPYSKIASPQGEPSSIFVTAIDTNPLAPEPSVVINEYSNDFVNGLVVLSRLTTNKVHVCKSPELELSSTISPNVVVTDFSGPHPAGLVGTHIHHLDPVNANKTVWTINYQDVIAIGKLFTEGKLYSDRVISLCGPQVAKPRLVRCPLGSSIEEVTAGQMLSGENRLISGSVLSGRTALGAEAFLGRYHSQITALSEGRERQFMHYMRAGFEKHSTLGIYISQLFSGKKFAFNTSTNGSTRAMVPVGSYEKIMPLDILPTQLLRALLVGDTDIAQQLGCLELDEEDLALCTYVCPGKYEYGPILRENLTRIEREG